MRTLDSSVSPYLDRLSSSISKSKEIVNTLLTISRKKTFQLQPVQLNSVARETIDFLSRALPKHITLVLRLAEDLPLIKADPTQISQVLINLVRNGCDAIPAESQGTVEIATAISPEPCLGAEVPEQARSVLLRISDSGVGMPEEIQEHIFEPFFTTKDPGQGTGLGLASVYSIVDSHSGVISFSSQTGQGTTFRILLPAALPDEGTDQPTQPSGLAAPSL
jgi:signal transduction histidine kinase